jgi:hypothetical protein
MISPLLPFVHILVEFYSIAELFTLAMINWWLKLD